MAEYRALRRNIERIDEQDGRRQRILEQASAGFLQVLILLGGGIAAGTLFKRLGLGTVLGYLFAGVLLGPVFTLVVEGEEILHVGELGVVFLLFVIGLELRPNRLWALRHRIFGLGLSQVVVSAGLIAGIAVLLGESWQAAVIIGLGLALSSTAFGLQLLEEANETNTRHGQSAFSVLLFQDIAVVPILVALPFLAPFATGKGIDPWQVAFSATALIGLVVGGRYLLTPLFRLMASAGAREVMLGAALFVVLGAALLMQAAGFSMGMGAFIAGVLLAESSYRHELEADIEPFRGLLLGLFFIGVGLSLDLGVIAERWPVILALTPLLMAVKSVALYGLSRLFGDRSTTAARVSGLLSQGGEFGFVIFSAAASYSVLTRDEASLLVAIVTLSMALTPLVDWAARRIATDRQDEEEMDEDFAGAGSQVLMIGFSRFGQMVAQVLLSSGTEVTIIDSSAQQIRSARRFGFDIYFGSGLRRDVLEAAGIRNARLVAICTNKRETTDRIVDLILSEFPNARLYVRAYDRAHALQLRARGVDYEVRETVESALAFGAETLNGLGFADDLAETIVADVRRRDIARLQLQEAEGIYAGRDMLTTRAVTPEPLIEPKERRHDMAEAPDPVETAGGHRPHEDGSAAPARRHAALAANRASNDAASHSDDDEREPLETE